MKTIVLNLTDAQFRRLALAAALLHAEPEHFVVGIALGELDANGGDWEGIEPALDAMTTEYGERKRAFRRSAGREFPIEETATSRRLNAAKRIAFARSSRKAVRHA